MTRRCSTNSGLLGTGLLAAIVFVAAPVSSAEGVFARVGDETISYEDFEREVVMAARQTYYHGRPSSNEAFVQFRKSVAEDLVDRHLLLREADRRGIEPDREYVVERLKTYQQRYEGTDRWKTEGGKMLAALRQHYERTSTIEILEREVRTTGQPTDTELRTFYSDNADKFTEPPQRRLSVIVLSVAPSATPLIWAAARAEAERILDRIRDGADFSDLARLHSSDPSAQRGGDMGYLHAGMLSPAAESAVGDLAVGELSEPVTVLEGIALFRLTDRKPERVRPFTEVTTRAAELWARDASDQQWAEMLAKLRGADDIYVDSAYLSSVPSAR